jgi:hypothetical protein
MSKRDKLPPASESCTRVVASLVSQGFSPEEYAARFAHTIGHCSLEEFRYSDPALDAWIARLGEILFRAEGAPTVEELRERLLTAEERLAIENDEGW